MLLEVNCMYPFSSPRGSFLTIQHDYLSKWKGIGDEIHITTLLFFDWSLYNFRLLKSSKWNYRFYRYILLSLSRRLWIHDETLGWTFDIITRLVSVSTNVKSYNVLKTIQCFTFCLTPIESNISAIDMYSKLGVLYFGKIKWTPKWLVDYHSFNWMV